MKFAQNVVIICMVKWLKSQKYSEEENKMKKLLSIVLALSFVLCASTVFAVSAGTALGSTDWEVKAGNVSALDGGIATWAAGANSMITYKGSISAGKVEVNAGLLDLYNEVHFYILFGAKGIKASTETTATAIMNDANVSAYMVYYANGNIYLGKVVNGSYTTLLTVPFTYGHLCTRTTTIEWTEEGAIKVWVNGSEIADFANAGNICVPFGNELAIRGNTTSRAVSINSTTVTPDPATAPDTADSTSLYFIASAVALAAAFAVVCFARKKKVAE